MLNHTSSLLYSATAEYWQFNRSESCNVYASGSYKIQTILPSPSHPSHPSSCDVRLTRVRGSGTSGSVLGVWESVANLPPPTRMGSGAPTVLEHFYRKHVHLFVGLTPCSHLEQQHANIQHTTWFLLYFGCWMLYMRTGLKSCSRPTWIAVAWNTSPGNQWCSPRGLSLGLEAPRGQGKSLGHGLDELYRNVRTFR
jgi:hypothetical protein